MSAFCAIISKTYGDVGSDNRVCMDTICHTVIQFDGQNGADKYKICHSGTNAFRSHLWLLQDIAVTLCFLLCHTGFPHASNTQ